MPFRLSRVTITFAIWYEPEYGFPLLLFPLLTLFPFISIPCHLFPFLSFISSTLLYSHLLFFSFYGLPFPSSPLFFSLSPSFPLLLSFLSIYFLSFPSLPFPPLSSSLFLFFHFLPFSSHLFSFLSFSISFNLLFSFPFISPHPLAQLTHLADLTNEDTTHLSLIPLYPIPHSLHLPPPALLHPSADKMVKTCVAAAALPTAAAFNNSSRREQHSFRPELCEHQLFLKWAE